MTAAYDIEAVAVASDRLVAAIDAATHAHGFGSRKEAMQNENR